MIFLSSLVFFVLWTPAHGQMSFDKYIKTKMHASQGTIFENRNNRNLLLKKIEASSTPKILTPEERQNILIQEFSISISNLKNIQDRINTRTNEEASSGKDVSDIQTLLSKASDGLLDASSTLADLVSLNSSSSLATEATSSTVLSSTTLADLYDARAMTIKIIQETSSIKETLQEALDSLEKII